MALALAVSAAGFNQLTMRSLPVCTFKDAQSLSFVVAPAATAEQLYGVLILRQEAYGRHAYKRALRQSLSAPDACDLSDCAVTLVAIDKATHSMLGTVRVTSNLDASIELPGDLPHVRCLDEAFVYVDRLAVCKDCPHPDVVRALMKGAMLWAKGRDARWLVALARAPLARFYKRGGGLTLQGDAKGVVMPDYHDDPYFLLGASVLDAAANLRLANPDAASFLDAVHPDIRVQGQGLSWKDWVLESHNEADAPLVSSPLDSGNPVVRCRSCDSCRSL
jgi:hypothetical protein